MVKPGSKHRECVEKQDDGSFVLYLKARPVGGKANVAALAVLAKYFGVTKTAVHLVQGATSKHKLFDIEL